MRLPWLGLIGACAAVLTGCATPRAQFQGSAADVDSTAREYRGGGGAASLPAASRNATVDELNKILSASQLSPTNRAFYLSLRAFVFSRMGREADSQKDVAEMGRIDPEGWPLMMWITMPALAGGGDRGAALRSLGYALERKPNDPWLLIARAQVQMQIADFPAALATLDSAVAAAATTKERRPAYYFRGQANLNLGNYAKAVQDFDAVLEGQTTLKGRLGVALWRYAAQVRSGQDARGGLIHELGNENLSVWPGPVAKFLTGRLPAGELEVAAESDDAAKKSNGKCIAAYFIGMDAVRRNDRQRARDQLQLAQARCPTTSEFNWAATSELKRL